jgi:DNA-binding Lrp family transcriptional regulator
MMPPSAQMNQLLASVWTTQAISVITRLGVPEALAAGPKPVGELAAELGAHAPTLNRVLRALVGTGVVTAGEAGYELTELGHTLRPDVPDSLAATAVMLGSDWQLAIRSGLDDSIRTGRPASQKVWGKSLFEFLKDRPQDAAVFNAAMIERSARAHAAVAGGYDFGRFDTLVDVGGGHGYLLGAILAAHPGLRGVLFDQPDVVAGATAKLERTGVLDRCRPVGGDFFEAVPPSDGYIISNVLHDWDDEQVRLILRNCAAAMPPDGTVLISEWVLPDRAESDPVSTILDLIMLIVTENGRERTRSEFVALLAAAGLELTDVVHGHPGLPTLLEARLKP